MTRREQADPTDRELATRVTEEGDEIAFRTLYRRHTPGLMAFVSRVLGSADAEAEDVIQDTWIRAVGALERFRWEATLRTWLMGIALNRSREILRRAGKWVFDESAALTIPVPPHDPVDRLDLEGALRALPVGYRTVLVLHDLEGFTHPEIGERLGIAVGTSRSQLFHARRTMRRMLEAPGGDTEEGSQHARPRRADV
jgi:RNA polymerase sigma-70 factor (ECF subfamily)